MKLHFQKNGEGQALLIIHGLFGSADNWRGIAKQLSTSVQVITVDLRNHGRSPHDEDQSYTAMAADIAELITDQGIDSIDVIGHSIGGKVAMEFANSYPHFVRKLMVIDISPKQYEDRHRAIFEALLALDLSQYSKRNEIDDALAKNIADKAIRQFLLMNLVSSDTGFKWRINLKALSENYDQLLVEVGKDKVITVPTCFVRGGLSDYIGKSDIELIERQFINSEIKTVEGVGHWVHAEAPETFLKLTRLFFNYD